MLQVRSYIKFLDGRLGEQATVAFLPLHLGAYLPTISTEVRIGRQYALKLQNKHRLTFADFCLMQRVIDRGWCIKNKTRHLEFFYLDDENPAARYHLVIKANGPGDETWVATFHRTNHQQVQARLRRAKFAGTLVRTHAWWRE